MTNVIKIIYFEQSSGFSLCGRHIMSKFSPTVSVSVTKIFLNIVVLIGASSKTSVSYGS